MALIDDVIAANADAGGVSPDGPAPQGPEPDLTWESGGLNPADYLDYSAPGIIEMDPPGSGALAPTKPLSIAGGQRTTVVPAVAPAGGSRSVSVSHTGMTDGGIKRSNDLFGRASAVADAEYGRYAAESRVNQAQYDSDYSTLVDSARQVGEAEKAHANKQVDLLQREIDFHDHSAQLAKKIMLNGQVDRERYLGQYREQLAGVRQLAMTSGNPMNSMSAGQLFGLNFARFVQGFLAPRGINIDVNGQIDRMVQQGIQEHQLKIQNMRESANDQLHLFDIARQTSHDDAEALQRYKGMVIEGMKATVEQEAARFGSAVATSRAQQKIAEFNLQQDQVIEQLGERRRAAYIAYHQQAAQEAHYKGQLAIESQKAADEAAYHRALVAAKKPAWSSKIPDPGATVRDAHGKVVGVKNMWTVDPNAPSGVQEKAVEVANKEGNAYATGIKQLGKLRELRPPAMDDFTARYSPVEAGKRYDQAYREFNSQRNLIGEQLINYLTGAAAPEQQMNRIRSVLADDSGYQKGNNASGIDQLEKWMRDNFTSRMNQTIGIMPLSENEQDYRPANGAANDTDAIYDARFKGSRPQTTVIAREEAQAAQGGSDAVGPDIPNKVYREFTSSKKGVYWSPGEREYAVHIDTMARAAIDPVSVIKLHDVDERPEDVARDALAGLQRLATDKHIPEFRREYAALVLKKMANPDQLLSDLADSGQRETPQFK